MSSNADPTFRGAGKSRPITQSEEKRPQRSPFHVSRLAFYEGGGSHFGRGPSEAQQKEMAAFEKRSNEWEAEQEHAWLKQKEAEK